MRVGCEVVLLSMIRWWDNFYEVEGEVVMAKRKLRGHGEGSIYMRKDGRWVAQITLEDHSRKQFYGKSKKEVQEKPFISRVKGP